MEVGVADAALRVAHVGLHERAQGAEETARRRLAVGFAEVRAADGGEPGFGGTAEGCCCKCRVLLFAQCVEEIEDVAGDGGDLFDGAGFVLKRTPVQRLPLFHRIEPESKTAHDDCAGLGIAAGKRVVTAREIRRDADDFAGGNVDDGAAAVAGNEFGGDLDAVGADANERAGERGDDAAAAAVAKHEHFVADLRVRLERGEDFERLGRRLGEGEAHGVVADGGFGDAGFEHGAVDAHELRLRHAGGNVDVREEPRLRARFRDEAAAGTAAIFHNDERVPVLLHELAGLRGSGGFCRCRDGCGRRRGRGRGCGWLLAQAAEEFFDARQHAGFRWRAGRCRRGLWHRSARRRFDDRLRGCCGFEFNLGEQSGAWHLHMLGGRLHFFFDDECGRGFGPRLQCEKCKRQKDRSDKQRAADDHTAALKKGERGKQCGHHPREPEDERPMRQHERHEADAEARPSSDDRLFIEIEAQPQPRPRQQRFPIRRNRAVRIHVLIFQKARERLPDRHALGLHEIFHRKNPRGESRVQFLARERAVHPALLEHIEGIGWRAGGFGSGHAG